MDPFTVANHPAFAGHPHFTSIQRAIDVAAAWGSEAIVRVYPGTYSEDVTLRPGVALAGAGAGMRFGAVGSTIYGGWLPMPLPIIAGRVRTAGGPGLYTLEGLCVMPPSGIAVEVPSGAPAGTWLAMRMCDVTAPQDADAGIALRGAAGAMIFDTTLNAPSGLVRTGASMMLHDSTDYLRMERCLVVCAGGPTDALRIVHTEAQIVDCEFFGRIRHEGGGEVVARGGQIMASAPLFVTTHGGGLTWRGGVLEAHGDETGYVATYDPPTSAGGFFDFGGSVVVGGVPLVMPGAWLRTTPCRP